MPPQTMLVVSDPPHGHVKEEAAADAIGLPPEHALLKIKFSAPEVLAAADRDEAVEVTFTLKAAGLSVEMREGFALCEVPWPTIVSRFEFGGDALVLDVEEGNVVEIGYDEPVFGVSCDPPPDFTPPVGAPGPPPPGTVLSGPAAADALEWVSHLDLYLPREGSLRRVTIEGGGMVAVAAECRSRFTELTLDSRLEGVRPRRRFVAGEAGFDPDKRKRYAFGTLLLRHVLESISTELRDLTQYELGSRLAWLLHGDSAGS